MSHNDNLKKILITNDDGIEGKGLRVLADSLSKVAQVFILAPDSDRSAVSSKITMGRNYSFQKVKENVFTCSGTPADCVIAALSSNMFDVKFDAVFSGINAGPNMGTDVIYSGTCAAARQGVLMGIPGIAVSLESEFFDYSRTGFNFQPLADFCAKNLDSLISLCTGEVFVSLNATSAENYKEALFASGCIRNYGDYVVLNREEADKFTGSCMSKGISVTGNADSDYNIARSGKVAVSLIYAEPVLKSPDVKMDFKF